MIHQVEVLEGCPCGRENASLEIISFSKKPYPLIFFSSSCWDMSSTSACVFFIITSERMYFYVLAWSWLQTLVWFWDCIWVPNNENSDIKMVFKVLFIPGVAPVTLTVPNLKCFRGWKTLLQFLVLRASAIKEKEKQGGGWKKRRKYVEGVIRYWRGRSGKNCRRWERARCNCGSQIHGQNDFE